MAARLALEQSISHELTRLLPQLAERFEQQIPVEAAAHERRATVGPFLHRLRAPTWGPPAIPFRWQAALGKVIVRAPTQTFPSRRARVTGLLVTVSAGRGENWLIVLAPHL